MAREKAEAGAILSPRRLALVLATAITNLAWFFVISVVSLAETGDGSKIDDKENNNNVKDNNLDDNEDNDEDNEEDNDEDIDEVINGCPEKKPVFNGNFSLFLAIIFPKTGEAENCGVFFSVSLVSFFLISLVSEFINVFVIDFFLLSFFSFNFFPMESYSEL